MNLNTHIVFALAVGLVLFHNNLLLAVVVGIGAALPDLDREYVFTNRAFFARHQLHRALFHNVFFGIALTLFNPYLGLGIFLHMLLDMLTSPPDRGIELFFPLGRLIKEFKLDYEGRVRKKGGLMWLLEDPLTLVNRTADKGLREVSKMPWLRIYGPFKNSRLIDWTIFYSSVIFIQLLEINQLLNWWVQFLSIVFLKYNFITLGIILFYGIGELWRRRLQFMRVSKNTKIVIISLMTLGGLMIVYQGLEMFNPIKLTSYEIRMVELILISLAIGFISSIIHMKWRFKEIVM
ncbi:metal-dependent hydrolase [Sulfolobus sp. S-194]|uniref:metal-dependent hydrolase n=1 Tax=Sulfolobus sp. S-194 TaxID=2512240 RepID=UPI001436E69D|nr:metal-dependent hydrolase [Sulfolobus sp. S-194]QIW23182.1 metal-dependent hydrolase [Sulfolobus sp. S-194]